MKELNHLIENWNENESGTKKAFVEIVDHLNSLDRLTLDFVARPGISYSLRPRHESQNDRSLFAMVDCGTYLALSLPNNLNSKPVPARAMPARINPVPVF